MAYTYGVRFDDLFANSMAYTPLSSQTGKAELAASIGRLFPRGGGVYLLTDADDQMIQLASAGDLRRALQNRLLEPEQSSPDQAGKSTGRKLNLGQIVRKIRWQPAHSMFEINYLYYRIARVLMPDDYLENLAFGPSWFVHVHPSAVVPRFVAAKVLHSPPGVDLGPFATHSDAANFIQILEDAFDLCRYPHILEQAPNGQPCAYFEMGKCPGPCDGSIPISEYRQMISSALSFACGQRSAFFNDLEDRMREAASRKAFEQAGMIKQRLERAKGIQHDAFRFVRPMEAFDYLIVQRGGGRTKLKSFFVRSGQITPGPIVKLKDIEQVVHEWMETLRKNRNNMHELDAVGTEPRYKEGCGETSEQVWLVSHYLFKNDAPGLFVHSSELNSPQELSDRIRAKFLPKQRESTEPTEPPLVSNQKRPKYT